MKVPLRYQNTEYDCGTTSFVNALAYLYDREDIPIELLKTIYKFTLDVEGKDGIEGTGGTSRKHAELLAKYFIEYANKNDKFDINCKILNGKDDDVAIVLHETFTHNRLVKIERLFDESLKDFSLLEESKRSIILMNR